MSNVVTFKDRLEQLQKLKRRLAIWEALHYLADEKFVSKDGRKTISAIKVPDTGDVILEEEIEDVLQQIGEGPIAELKAEILIIESQEVVVITDKKASA